MQYGRLNAGKGSYLQRYNADYNKDNKWLVKGKTINKSKIYTVAFSDYLLKGLDIPFLKPENKGIISVYKPTKKEMNYDIRNSVISFMKKTKEDNS